jgi:phosphatidylglycerophosphate synthase
MLNDLAGAHLNGQPMLFRGGSGAGAVLACSAETLAQLPDLNEHSESEDSAPKAFVNTLEQVDTVTLGHHTCIRVTDAASAHRAERELFAQLRASTAESDGPLARWIDRSASQWLSYRLVHTPLRPNHITAIGTAVGLLAAWCLAQGVYSLQVLGASLFLCATVIDGCDGEVARLKFQETRFGRVFDITTDNIVHTAIFVAIGLGQYRQHPGGNYPVLIALLLGGFIGAAAATYWCFLRAPQGLQKSPRPHTTKGKIRRLLLRGFEAVGNRDFAYLLLVLALFGRLHWFFWGTLLGTYGFTAALIWVYRWRDAS